MNKDNPLVSIITRTKDRPKLLKRALQSIAVQNYRPIEVILVNDGGCDLNVKEIESILRDVSLNYIRLEENTGRAHAGNVGIGNARGEYIGFLDDDDEFHPDHIFILISFLNDRDDFVGAYTDSEIVQREYDSEGNIIKECDREIFKSYDFSYEVLLFENYIPLHCSLLRKKVLLDIGGFDEDLEMFEDWDLLLRASEISPFYHITKVTTKYIQWSKIHQIAFINWHNAKDYYLKVLSKHSGKITPDAVYRYFLAKQEEMINAKKILREIHGLSSGDIRIISKLKEELDYKDKEIQALKDIFSEMKAIKEELRIKTAYIEEIQSGVGWMILDYYRRHIKNKLAPVGTKRWSAYNKVLKGLKTLKREGFKAFLGKVKRFFREVKSGSSIKHEFFVIPKVRDDLVEDIDTKISVIIPTKNAGPDFRHVLEKIRRQKDIEDIDIIILDSGSEDDTLDLAKRYQAKIFLIHPSEFGHGRTRNHGAQHASGEYIIFLSQDAIPIGDSCFKDMIQGMKNNPGIAAVSAKQIPRSDADIFACWQIWNHYENFLRYSEDKVVSINHKMFDLLSPSDKRRVAQIDNIFSCIRKDIFDQFMFNDMGYAEDLDLGLRLIKNGYKIGFLSSVGVIHSHNRNSAYYFKRSYVDRKSLVHLLGFEPMNWRSIGIDSFPEMVHYVQSTYSRLDYAFQYLAQNKARQKADISLFDSLHQLVHMCPSKNRDSANDISLNSAINELVTISGTVGIDISINMDVLLEQFFSVLESFKKYLTCYETLDDKFEEIISALYKLCAVVLGANIGDYLAFYEMKNGVEETLKFDDILGKCV